MRHVILFFLLISTIVFSPILVAGFLIGAVFRIGEATFVKGYNGMDEAINSIFDVYLKLTRRDVNLYVAKQTRGVK